MEFSNSDGSIGKILLRSIRIHLILYKKYIFSSIKIIFLGEKLNFLVFLCSFFQIRDGGGEREEGGEGNEGCGRGERGGRIQYNKAFVHNS